MTDARSHFAADDLADQAAARALNAQVRVWRDARPARRGATETGVPVVRRSRRLPALKVSHAGLVAPGRWPA